MSARSLAPIAVVAAACAVGLFFLLRDSGAGAPAVEPSPLLNPERPTSPPVPGRDRPTRAPSPEMPSDVAEIGERAFSRAMTAGIDRPGEAAFRATIDAFMAYNAPFAKAQAKQEGITVDEVGELTYFGFLVQQTQRWSEVEEIIGRTLDEDERALGEQLMHDANREFKDQMRKLVRKKASPDQRWKLIRDTEARYRQEYFALTGMDAGMLDDLLAGDLARKYAPANTPPPPIEDIEPAPAPPPVEPRPGPKPE